MWPTFDVKSLETFKLMLTVDDEGVRSGCLLRRSALSGLQEVRSEGFRKEIFCCSLFVWKGRGLEVESP